VCERVGEGKADAVAIVPVPERVAVREAGSAIGYVDGQPAAAGAHGDGDRAGTVTVRVVEQDLEDLSDDGGRGGGDALAAAPGGCAGGERRRPAGRASARRAPRARRS
jgi:hypothetical protein